MTKIKHGFITAARIMLWDSSLTIRQNAVRQEMTYGHAATLAWKYQLKHEEESTIKPLWKGGYDNRP